MRKKYFTILSIILLILLLIPASSKSQDISDLNYTFEAGFSVNTTNQLYEFQSFCTSIYPTQYYWQLGDGSIDTGQIVQHEYSTTGTFLVNLKAVSTDPLSGDVFVAYSQQTITITALKSSIFGNIFIDSIGPDFGYVVLYKLDSAGGLFNIIDTTNFINDSNKTYFYFGSIIHGKYLTKAFLANQSIYKTIYVPTFGLNELHWDDAEIINLNSNTSELIIDMIRIQPNAGPCSISGNISSLVKDLDGSPVDFAEIQLFDNNNQLVGFTRSNSNGDFQFTNLDYGKYKVYAEVINKLTIAPEVSLTIATPNVGNVNLFITSSGVTTFTSNPNFESLYISEPYPNPAKSNFRIDFISSKSEKINIRVLNSIGITVFEKNLVIESGDNNIELDINQFSDGLYFIDIELDNGARISKRVIKIKN